jgi:modulator of FtsH protease
MAFDPKAWSDYGVAVVGGAAVLTGLLFVAVSVNAAWFSSSEAHRGRAGQALVLFVVPLVTGILLLIPGQTTTSLGIEIGACVGALVAGLVNAWIFLLVAGARREE